MCALSGNSPFSKTIGIFISLQASALRLGDWLPQQIVDVADRKHFKLFPFPCSVAEDYQRQFPLDSEVIFLWS